MRQAHRLPMAHRVVRPSWYAFAEFGVYVGGIIVLLYLLFWWLPQP